ncbi:MAG: phage minor head protein [Kiritimatiellia bacterium]
MKEDLLKPVPFDEAIAFLKAKPVLSSQVFRTLYPELQARAFTITGLEGAANVMQAVRDRIAELPAGANWDEVKKDIVNDVSPFLVDPSADPEERDRQIVAANRRAELLMRIHGFQSYMAAQHEVLQRQKEVFPYWQYVTVGDDRVRDSHAALNDLILPADSPFWADHYPPWDWGCRCDVIPMMQEDVDQIQEEDKQRNPEDHLVMDGARLRQLEEGGQLIRGPVKLFEPNDPSRTKVSHILPGGNHYVAAPISQGKEGAFAWNPKDMRISVEELEKRHDPLSWAVFKAWAENTVTSSDQSGPTVWQWLTETGKPLKASPPAKGS